MRKWSYYATEVLRNFAHHNNDLLNFKFSQALLQHYGWRSFFVDFSSDYKTACWFAANNFTQKTSIEMSEDFEENPLWLFHNTATYKQVDEEKNGHLYVLSIKKAEEIKHDLCDLTQIPIALALRPSVQHGWLVGNLGSDGYNEALDPACIVAHIQAPISILASISNLTVSDLFPTKNDDAFLYFLESFPWNHIKEDFFNSAFRRSIEIPDYHFTHQKRYPSEQNFYKELWISDKVAEQAKSKNMDCVFRHALFFRVEDTAFFHTELIPTHVPNLRKLLIKNSNVVLESDLPIISLLESEKNSYVKGISITSKDSDIFIELIEIHYSGSVFKALEVKKGYRYAWENDNLIRNPNENDCPCGDTFRHERLLSILTGIDSYIPSANKISKNVYSVVANY